MSIIQTMNWKVSGIRGVLFDKDGTLIDSHVYWGRIINRRAKAIISLYALDPTELTGLAFAMGYDSQAGGLRPEGPIALVSREEVIAVVERYLVERGITTSAKELSALFSREHEAFLPEVPEYLRLLPGVPSILYDLKQNGARIAVVTTDTISNTQTMLEHFQLSEYVDVVVGKESTSEPKITGAPAIEAVRQLKLAVEDVVSVGDAPMDLIMAEKSGLKAGIGVASGQLGLDVLGEYSPYLAHSLTELLIDHDT